MHIELIVFWIRYKIRKYLSNLLNLSWMKITENFYLVVAAFTFIEREFLAWVAHIGGELRNHRSNSNGFFAILLILTILPATLKQNTEGPMADLVAVKQSFREIVREALTTNFFLFMFLIEIVCLKTNYSELSHVGSLSIIK